MSMGWGYKWKYNANYNNPSQFAAVTPVGSRVSFGDINYTSAGVFSFSIVESALFSMRVNNSTAGTINVTQLLAYIDNIAYFYLNGSLIYTKSYPGDINVSITWPLVSGDNLVQVVFNNSGVVGAIWLVGDIVNGSTITFVGTT